MINKGLFTSKTGEWETPQDFFDDLSKEFHFNLDVCATKKNAKCKRYYTKEDDGLSKSWKGRVWCNPPYGREVTGWVLKAFLQSHASKKEAEIIVMLLPARTDTKWFHNYIYNKAEIRFLKGRLKFGGSKNSAPFPSMLVIFK